VTHASDSSSSKELTICEFNVENLFVSMPYYDGQDLEKLSASKWRAMALPQFRNKQKTLKRLWGLSRAILDINPDILMLVEVGGEDSLVNFNLHFLGDRFKPWFVDGNSKRAIDLGFLTKKELGFKIETRSNKDFPVEVNGWHGKEITKFSRDVAELRLHDETGLRLILLLTHLKSKISTEDDHLGNNRRTAEAIALVRIYEELSRQHADVPIVVGGDFNAELASLELEMIRHTNLVDFHDILGTEPEKRTSLVHFDFYGQPNTMALDYLLISPHLRESVVIPKSYTYRYKAFYGIPEEVSQTPGERIQNPSDHYPLVLTIRI
jgi:endonuclease/exonuclease/phosphatase family metal-dependent hydrolase